jgi:hypothetical protein
MKFLIGTNQLTIFASKNVMGFALKKEGCSDTRYTLKDIVLSEETIRKRTNAV